MGSGSSKESATAAPSSSAGGVRGARSKGSRIFNSSCFGLPPTLSDDQNEEENIRSDGKNCTDEVESISSEKLRLHRPSNMPSLTCHLELSGKGQDNTAQIDLGASSSSNTTAAISRSENPSGRLRSRFGFHSDGIGFRLNRAVSLGSSGTRARFSTNPSIPSGDGGNAVCVGLDSSSDRINDTQENTTMETNSSRDVVRNDAIIEATVSGHSQRNNADHASSFEMRHSSRRLGPQESLEGSVRFSRTLSVGRLRDRVLRGTSLSEGLFGLAPLEDRSIGYMAQLSGRRVLGGTRRALSSNRNNEVLPDSSINHSYHRSSSMDNGHEQGSVESSETPQLREAVSRDLLGHRSAFLERRRRIRSQVRALQRLGSRFENISGHDRSCILSGQHRTGRCTCRTSNRPANPDDDMSTRASISRIVMLAEALFEVLDEIHHQSVVLSSRPSFSSIGSVPAPKEVVECMPLKAYMKPQKHQNEAEQCYICLVEYEEGDRIRILPCNHEFHQTCIDKWLKEIHRVCPLCRGDVCRTDLSSMEKLS